MPEDLFDEPERRAEEKIRAAVHLMSRGRLREALDALNLAIQLSPANPEAFLQRAEVFERMGLLPQAEADRKRGARLVEQSLAASSTSQPVEEERVGEEGGPPGVPEAEGEEALPVEEAARPAPASHEAAPQQPYLVPGASAIPREPAPGPGPRVWLFMAVVSLLFLAGVAVGIVVAAGAVDWSGLDPFGDGGSPGATGTPFATGQAGGEATATATAEPTTPPDASTTGDPYSLSALERAWEGKGMAVKAGATSSGFSGFGTAPIDVTLTRGGATAALSVFVYRTREAALAEWELVPGSRPAAKGERTVPGHVSAWWNANVVVILRSDPGGLGPDALDGLLNVGG